MIAATPTLAQAAPLSGPSLLSFLTALTGLLLLARLLGALGARCGLPAVAGELLAGFVVGPSLLGRLAPGLTAPLLTGPADTLHLLDGFAQVGVLLLVGITATRVDVGGLRGRGRAAATISVCGLVVPLAAGIGLGMLLAAGSPGSSPFLPAFLGIALCVSAVPVIAKTLADMHLLHRDIGQLTLAAAVIDDGAAWLFLSVVSAAATAGLTASGISVEIALLAVFLVVALTVGRVLVRRVMSRLAAAVEPGPVVAGAVLVMLIGAVGTQAIGMEPIFGAFVAGLLVTGSPAAVARLASLRTVTLAVFTPLFLATAGLRADLTALADPRVALTAAAVLATAVVGKFAGVYLGAKIAGYGGWRGLALGAGLNARGVVEVIIALTGLRLGVFDLATYTIIVLVALATSVMAPPLLRLAMSRVAPNESERLRAVTHAAWDGEAAAVRPATEDRAA